MSCNIKLNTDNFLVTQDIITEGNKIKNMVSFVAYNKALTDLAFNKYGVGDKVIPLYSIENTKGGKIAIPNDTLFELLEEQTTSDERYQFSIEAYDLADITDDKAKDVFTEKEDKVEEEDTTEEQVESIYTELDTLEKKYDYALRRINESIELNISELQVIANRRKDEKAKELLMNRINVLNTLNNNINELQNTSKAEAVSAFVKNMAGALEFIDRRLSKLDFTDTKAVLSTAKNFSNYLTTYSVISDISEMLVEAKTDPDQTIFTSSELDQLKREIEKVEGGFSARVKQMNTVKKAAMGFVLNDIQYFPEIYTKHKDRLTKEYKQLGSPGDKNVFINSKLEGRDAQLLQDDIDTKVNNLMENVMFDVYASDVTFSAAINVSSEFIQIVNKMLVDIDNKRITIERKEDITAKKIFEDLKKEKGSTNVNTLYKNIVEHSKSGEVYLKGDFSVKFLTEVRDKIRGISAKYNTQIKELTIKTKLIAKNQGYAADDYIKSKKKLEALVLKKKAEIATVQKGNIEFDSETGKAIGPSAKWKNNLNSLSTAEAAALQYFKGIVDKGREVTYGKDTLLEYSYGAFFYQTPKITKSDAERTYAGDLKGIVKDKKDYLTKTRADDTEYTTKNIDLANNPIRQLRVHYRDRSGEFNHKDQSMDLSTIFRLEFKNLNTYDIRKTKESEINFMLDIVKQKKFYQREGISGVIARRNKKLNITQDANSNTYKMLNNMIEQRFYDIMVQNRTKINSVDLNHAANVINGVSAFVSLSFNMASGTANVLNANAQMFLETFIKGDTFTASNIAKANKIYSKNITASLKDTIAPINTSYVNQISEMFNIKGLLTLSDSNFLQSSLIKKGLSSESLQVFQNSGEHWIQSVLTMAVLDNIKVKNKENRFINKDGKVVKTEKAAASLLDMLKQDPTTGLVELDTNVIYTTHSNLTKWDEGGKVNIDLLIRKKLDDTVGNYTKTQQANVYRHWLGKLGMLYRKYLIPMGQARLRGIEHSLTEKDALEDHQRTYSYALQQYEEGTYTTLIRYAKTALRSKKTGLLAFHNWKNLTEYEKHNIKRSVGELITTLVILPLATNILAALGSGLDDDDKDEFFFWVYQLRRLETELSAYYSVPESFKMLKSPIPSVRIIESGMDVLENVFTPLKEDGKGDNVLYKSVKRLNPARHFFKDFQKMYEYQNSKFLR